MSEEGIQNALLSKISGSGSARASSHNQESVEAMMRSKRVGLTPRGTEKMEHPFPHGQPPKPATSDFRRTNVRRGSFR